MAAPSTDPSLDQQAVPAPADDGGRSDPAGSTEALDRAARPLAARGGTASQRDRLLSWARAGHVIHQDDWYSRGADGGRAIRAVRSRIPELEALGYGFDHTTRPDRTTEYRLAYVPEHRPTPAPQPEPRDRAGASSCTSQLDRGP
jgi:hypothetical protein